MQKIVRLASNVVSASALAGLLVCATVGSVEAKVAVTAGHTFSGYSHHYGDHLHGRRTSSGQPHNKFKLTCAHRTLPFGTHLQVTNTKNGKSCVVVVNDRGPFGNPNLVLDVSKAAAHALGFPGGGKIPISARVLDKHEGFEGLKQSHQCDAVKNYIAQHGDAASIAALPPKAVAAKPIIQAHKVVASLPAKHAPVLPSAPEPVAKPEAPETTFLLVINDALENEKSAQHAATTADYNTTARHATYAPTVFMPIGGESERAVSAQKKPSTARAIPEGQTLM
jgi:rare lipoprotein A